MQSHISENALESRARRAARRVELRAVKSRRSESCDNLGGFMLVDLWANVIVAGSRFELSPDDVIEYCTAN